MTARAGLPVSEYATRLVKKAIVGTGGRGTQNLKALLALADAQVSAIADPAETFSLENYYYKGVGGRLPALKIVDDQIYVLGRDQITRLHDIDGDGEADFYENFNNDVQVTSNFHEFMFDLQTDSQGNFYFLKGGPVNPGGRGWGPLSDHHGCIFKVSADGQKFEDLAKKYSLDGSKDYGGDLGYFTAAEMVPVEFWSYLNSAIKHTDPEATLLAEVYNPKQYRDYLHLGKMDYLYDKVDFYDHLKLVMQGKASTDRLVDIRTQFADIEPHLLHFLENHDEQRIASAPFAGDARKGLPAMVVSATIGTAPTMLYFGQDVGEKGDGDAGYGPAGDVTRGHHHPQALVLRPGQPSPRRLRLHQRTHSHRAPLYPRAPTSRLPPPMVRRQRTPHRRVHPRRPASPAARAMPRTPPSRSCASNWPVARSRSALATNRPTAARP